MVLSGFLLIRRGYAMPKPVKTGTTIAGVVFADGIVLGADTRYVGRRARQDRVLLLHECGVVVGWFG